MDDKAQIEHYRKALDTSFFRVNTLLNLLRLKLDPDDPKRAIDAEVWRLIKRIDELDVREIAGGLGAFEAAFFDETEALRKADLRRKLSPEWERVIRLE